MMLLAFSFIFKNPTRETMKTFKLIGKIGIGGLAIIGAFGVAGYASAAKDGISLSDVYNSSKELYKNR